VSWGQRFYDPIELAGRKPRVTLRDAALYITKLPKAEHDTEEWQTEMQAPMLVAEHDGPTTFARIGVMREAAQIPRRTATLERLHERDNKKRRMAMSTNDNARLLDEAHCARQA
jgi:hypothetical protein